MPKQKTKKSLTRRVKVTKTGKLLRRHGFNRHLKASKKKSRIRDRKRTVEITGAYAKKLRQVLGL